MSCRITSIKLNKQTNKKKKHFDFFLHRVQYENCSNRWTFHPAALVKVCTFQVGDIVTIDTNATKVEKLQKGHGEWVETMRNVSKFVTITM